MFAHEITLAKRPKATKRRNLKILLIKQRNIDSNPLVDSPEYNFIIFKDKPLDGIQLNRVKEFRLQKITQEFF